MRSGNFITVLLFPNEVVDRKPLWRELKHRPTKAGNLRINLIMSLTWLAPRTNFSHFTDSLSNLKFRSYTRTVIDAN